jgi:hypothetical protein
MSGHSYGFPFFFISPLATHEGGSDYFQKKKYMGSILQNKWKYRDKIRIIFLPKLLNKSKLQKHRKTHTAKDSLLLSIVILEIYCLLKCKRPLLPPEQIL